MGIRIPRTQNRHTRRGPLVDEEAGHRIFSKSVQWLAIFSFYRQTSLATHQTCNWIRNLPSDFFRVLKENALASVINSVGLWPFLGPQKVNLYFQHFWNSSIFSLLSFFLLKSLRNVSFDFSDSVIPFWARWARSKFICLIWNGTNSSHFSIRSFASSFCRLLFTEATNRRLIFHAHFHCMHLTHVCSFISSTFSKLNGTQSANSITMSHFYWNFDEVMPC